MRARAHAVATGGEGGRRGARRALTTTPGWKDENGMTISSSSHSLAYYCLLASASAVDNIFLILPRSRARGGADVWAAAGVGGRAGIQAQCGGMAAAWRQRNMPARACREYNPASCLQRARRRHPLLTRCAAYKAATVLNIVPLLFTTPL